MVGLLGLPKTEKNILEIGLKKMLNHQIIGLIIATIVI